METNKLNEELDNILNESNGKESEIKEIIRKVNAAYGKNSTAMKKKFSWWDDKFDATFNVLQTYRLDNLNGGVYKGKFTTKFIDSDMLDKHFAAVIKSTNITYKLGNTDFTLQ